MSGGVVVAERRNRWAVGKTPREKGGGRLRGMGKEVGGNLMPGVFKKNVASQGEGAGGEKGDALPYLTYKGAGFQCCGVVSARGRGSGVSK